jgi:hypothetical protein
MIVFYIIWTLLLALSTAAQVVIYLYLKQLVKTPWYYKENRFI